MMHITLNYTMNSKYTKTCISIEISGKVIMIATNEKRFLLNDTRRIYLGLFLTIQHAFIDVKQSVT